jgi:hypothetical protein
LRWRVAFDRPKHYNPAEDPIVRVEARVAAVPHEQPYRSAGKVYPGSEYDLVAMFDCLHDMGDPAGAAAHVRESLKSDGTWLIVAPFAHDELENNLNPAGRVFYCASTMVCTPASKAQEVGLALERRPGKSGFGKW